MKNIYYNASDIATLINKNPYKKPEEILHSILCKIKKIENTTEIDKFNTINKDTTNKLLTDFYNNDNITVKEYHKYKDKLNNCNDTYNISKFNKELLENISKKCININNTNDCINIQKNIEKNLDNILESDNKIVKEYMNSYINKNRGIQNEDKIIKEYSKKYNTNITNNNSKLYKLKLFDINDYSFYICGKIDGIENNELIEIKNRKNRLFKFIPEYEQIQIQCYFKLTSLKSGKLIENFNNEQNIILINNNDELWDIISNELKIVSNNLIKILNN